MGKALGSMGKHPEALGSTRKAQEVPERAGNMKFCPEMHQQGVVSVTGCNSISPLRTLSRGPKMRCVTHLQQVKNQGI